MGPDTDSCGDKVAPDANNQAMDCNGPTILIDYGQDGKKNTVASFMYFVPLISRTLVDIQTSASNKQQIYVVSYEREVTSNSFHVVCEFKISGKGFQKNTFDPEGMIAAHTAEQKKCQTLTNLLDYIKFEGEGLGCIEVKGLVDGSTETVTEVSLQFNARGHKSPVTVGLYDIKPENGKYKYEEKTNEAIARVNSLTFRRCEDNPSMAMKIASINKASESDCFMGNVKGLIANLFIKQTKVDKLGNDTMLSFGHALLKQKPSFTFPKAKNIKENITAVALSRAPQNRF
jgi:hypothetical protein